ncbi:MAG: EAL domain-containing protein [Lachnospiraceae bacterium]
MEVNPRFAITLLILSILFVCIWFIYVGFHSRAVYRKVFKVFMWSAVAMYLNRLFGIAMSEGCLPRNDVLLTLEQLLHFGLLMWIYVVYAYFICCLINVRKYNTTRARIFFFAPVSLMILIMVTSPWTHLFLYVQDGITYEGPLFLAFIIMEIGYMLGASAYAIVKRHLLPSIFGKSILLVMVFTVLQVTERLLTGDELLSYTTLIVNIVIFLLAITVVEFYKDGLTGLLNREAFEQYSAKEITRRGNKTVYLIKLKNYEYIRENCREFALLDVIKRLAECIQKCAKLPAIFYLGIGRYALIVNRRDRFDEKQFFQNLREQMDITLTLNGMDVHLNLFVAVMNLEDGKITRENFFKYFSACDDITYRSNEPLEVVYSDNLGIDRLQRYRNVEEAIERAIVEKEFQMYYQPIVSSETQSIVSAEALIRLNDRIFGFISPEEFIPISENNGKILEISEFVIDSVFRFVKGHDLEEMGLQFIEMNLSVMQCMDKKLLERLEYYINKYQIDPRQINLEITETATNFDENRLKEQLLKIKKLGFSFSLDDYGTGYSNLVRVLEYPVDVIKLDKSVVWSAFAEKNNYILLKNLISMFHDVQRKIVAEGVETEEQKDALTVLGCDYLQGYYYSKPVSEKEFLAFADEFQKNEST